VEDLGTNEVSRFCVSSSTSTAAAAESFLHFLLPLTLSQQENLFHRIKLRAYLEAIFDFDL